MTQLDVDPQAAPPAPRVLRRSTHDRMIAGVCGGLGHYFGVDPVWFRLAFVILLVGGGSGVLAYLICWIAIPEDVSTEETPNPAPIGTGPTIIGLILVGLGVMLFFNIMFPWFDRVALPMVLVAIGVGLLIKGGSR